jgi:hypothetical protein
MMGAAAREAYLAKYTPATNYQMLIRIYEEAVNRNSGRARECAGAPSGADADGAGRSADLLVLPHA